MVTNNARGVGSGICSSYSVKYNMREVFKDYKQVVRGCYRYRGYEHINMNVSPVMYISATFITLCRKEKRLLDKGREEEGGEK